MRISKLKTERRRVDNLNRLLGYLSFGEANDYPNRVDKILNASSLGLGCYELSNRFVFGDGIEDEALAQFIVNKNGDTANDIVSDVVKDVNEYGGFCLHFNVNGLAEIVETTHVPFEFCRIGIDLSDANLLKPDNTILIHPNWINEQGKPKFEQRNVLRIPLWDSDQKERRKVENYIETGFVLWVSVTNKLSYPLAPFDSVLADMATDQAISTVLHRNAKHNFMPAGMLVRKGRRVDIEEEGAQPDTFNQDLMSWQGAESSAKIIAVDVDFDEDKPEFISFPVNNFDRQFDSTQKYIEQKIGMAFNQPPILRGVDVGAGFGADLIANAYIYYNSICEPTRKFIERKLKPIFTEIVPNLTNFNLKPLVYETTSQQNTLSES